jgi:hypothetical protein
LTAGWAVTRATVRPATTMSDATMIRDRMM